jgi:GntR family transcriptional regulator, transcriptional repressor for pyruvate dehydrogenase complex
MAKKVSSIIDKNSDYGVTKEIISRVKEMILDGRLAPGARFPSERKLAEIFGVNRATVRQALKVLESMSVINQRVGDGTYLNTTAEDLLSEPLDFLILLDDLSDQELFGTRLIVEPELAFHAAERLTADDLGVLRNAILAMKASKTTKERLAADYAFHEAIFRASGDRICHLLFKQIHKFVLSGMLKLSNKMSVERPVMHHEYIYAALKARDADAARQAMRNHILDARSFLTVKPKRVV